MDTMRSCSVCCNPWSNDYSSVPVALPACGHSFCRHCLVTLYRRDQCIKCPICRKECRDVKPDDLHANFALLDVMATDEQTREVQHGEARASEPRDGTPPNQASSGLNGALNGSATDENSETREIQDGDASEQGSDDGTPPSQTSSGLLKGVMYGGAAVLGGVAAVAAAPVVLTTFGFTSAGIAASSYAASMMSAAAIANGGGVAAGGLVATLQAAGAAGLGVAGTAGVGAAGAAVGAGVAKVASEITGRNQEDEPRDENN